MDLSMWFDNQVQLKIVDDILPEVLVDKHAPHIEWMTSDGFQKWSQQHSHEYIFLELPSLFHVPYFGKDVKIPKGYGVMVPVFDFDWVYYTKNDTDFTKVIRFSPHQIRLENRMKDRQEWIQQNVRSSWEVFYNKRDNLDVYQRRMLLGLSKVLGEWRLVGELSHQCDWSLPIVQYDQAEVRFHTTLSMPLPERQQHFFQTLEQCGYWHETWWSLLECAADNPQIDKSLLLQTRLMCKAVLDTQTDFPEWCSDMPLFRWIPKKMVEEDSLFQKEISFLKRTDKLWIRHVFARVLHLNEPSSHHRFIQESLGFLPRLLGMEGYEKGDLLSLTDDPDFTPSSSGFIVYPDNPRWYLVNVRKVNYRILPNGSYITMKQGAISPTYNGISKNETYFMDRETLQPVSPVRRMKEDVPGCREEEIAIVGLEDVRLVPGLNQDVLFYGITKSYSYSSAIRIIVGKYDVERCLFHSTSVIHPPYEENSCEKNWTWCGNNRFIYKWYPVEIGSVDANQRLVVDERILSPPFFKEFRGSSPAVLWKGFHWFSVHSVGHGSNGRKYIHFIVVLDLQSKEHQVMAVSSPFCFEDVQIEYTIGLDIYKGRMVFLYSTMDSTSRYMRIPLFHILDKLCFPNKQVEIAFKTRIFQDVF